MRTINLTYFAHTNSLKEAGVEKLPPSASAEARTFLRFHHIPSVEELRDRAFILATIAKRYGADRALIGGTPYLLSALESALEAENIEPVYSFSERTISERKNQDGSTTQMYLYEHKGFVPVSGMKIQPSESKVEVQHDGILNLTTNCASLDMIDAGVHDPVYYKFSIRSELSFQNIPDQMTIEQRANELADIAVSEGYGKAVINGAPYLMSALETALFVRGIKPLYVFTDREAKNPVSLGFVEVEPQKPADINQNRAEPIAVSDPVSAENEPKEKEVPNKISKWFRKILK